MRSVFEDEIVDPGQLLWRYFRLDRIIESLKTQALYFPSARQFEDPFEGATAVQPHDWPVDPRYNPLEGAEGAFVRRATKGGNHVYALVLVHMTCMVLLVGSVLLSGTTHAAERTHSLRIGALTESWGPTPAMVGLRDGLLELGYHEHEQFVLGVRFTQGDLAVLPAAARDLVQYEVDLIFASDVPAAKAAQLATTRIPIVFAG